MSIKKPLLSVVIPTCKRPKLLSRAIESALGSAPSQNVEVIVVPNGSDNSWRQTATAYEYDKRVKWHPIETGHANVARNHGKMLAQGDYIRFLDDDDYFFPGAAKLQLVQLAASGMDLSVAPVSIFNIGESKSETYHLPIDYSKDFFSFVLNSRRNTLPTAYVFKRSFILQYTWDETISLNQDTKWMLDIASSSEPKWEIFKNPVGTWVQHTGDRISSNRDMSERMQLVYGMLKSSLHRASPHRLNDLVIRAYLDGAWRCIHSGFLYKPRYWSSVIREVLEINPDYTPEQPILRILKKMSIPLVYAEWIIFPIRRFGLKVKKSRRLENP